jgi:potassium-transporting ATPase potassium-binding subunit
MNDSHQSSDLNQMLGNASGVSATTLNANSAFYNATTVVAMLAGRFGLAALTLALAGRFAAQGRRPISLGSLPSDTVTFGVLILGTILLVGALSFLPALVLGPIVELLQS